jgi:hypothetical protein
VGWQLLLLLLLLVQFGMLLLWCHETIFKCVLSRQRFIAAAAVCASALEVSTQSSCHVAATAVLVVKQLAPSSTCHDCFNLHDLRAAAAGTAPGAAVGLSTFAAGASVLAVWQHSCTCTPS